jgi:hypothetical protein
MPQFDSYSYSNQVFWTLFGFFLLFFFLLNFYLVDFSEVFKMRQKLIAFFLNKKKSLVFLFLGVIITFVFDVIQLKKS